MDDFGDDGDVDWDNVFNEETDPSNSNENSPGSIFKNPEIDEIKEPQRKKPRLFPGPAGIAPKLAIDTKVIRS